jgi:hypothetical protein
VQWHGLGGLLLPHFRVKPAIWVFGGFVLGGAGSWLFRFGGGRSCACVSRRFITRKVERGVTELSPAGELQGCVFLLMSNACRNFGCEATQR